MEGSPTGSPHAGGAGATVDGAELARRMMAATEAASAATQLAARALEELKTATERTSENKDWYKLLSKPSSFDPSSREAEISGWRDWSWSSEQYLGSLDSVFTEEIRVLEITSRLWLTRQPGAMQRCAVVHFCMDCWLRCSSSVPSWFSRQLVKPTATRHIAN